MVPSSPTFVRFPLRPNPAREWLEKKRKQDGSPAATPPAPSGKTLDLALLLSCLPERYYRWLMAALPPFAAKTPPLHPLRGLADAPRAGFPPLLFRPVGCTGCVCGWSLSWRLACLLLRHRSGS